MSRPPEATVHMIRLIVMLSYLMLQIAQLQGDPVLLLFLHKKSILITTPNLFAVFHAGQNLVYVTICDITL